MYRFFAFSLLPFDFLMAEPKQVTLLGGDDDSELSLLDIIDHVLNAGVVLHGSLVISMAGVDLVYLGLNVVLTSVETALRQLEPQARGPRR